MSGRYVDRQEDDRRQTVRDYIRGERRQRERRKVIQDARVTHWCTQIYNQHPESRAQDEKK